MPDRALPKPSAFSHWSLVIDPPGVGVAPRDTLRPPDIAKRSQPRSVPVNLPRPSAFSSWSSVIGHRFSVSRASRRATPSAPLILRNEANPEASRSTFPGPRPFLLGHRSSVIGHRPSVLRLPCVAPRDTLRPPDIAKRSQPRSVPVNLPRASAFSSWSSVIGHRFSVSRASRRATPSAPPILRNEANPEASRSTFPGPRPFLLGHRSSVIGSPSPVRRAARHPPPPPILRNEANPEASRSTFPGPRPFLLGHRSSVIGSPSPVRRAARHPPPPRYCETKPTPKRPGQPSPALGLFFLVIGHRSSVIGHRFSVSRASRRATPSAPPDFAKRSQPRKVQAIQNPAKSRAFTSADLAPTTPRDKTNPCSDNAKPSSPKERSQPLARQSKNDNTGPPRLEIARQIRDVSF